MKVNTVHPRLGVFADSVLTGFADIDTYHDFVHDFDCMLVS